MECLNPVVRNAALEAHFGPSPSSWASIPEHELVRCHLNYALASLVQAGNGDPEEELSSSARELALTSLLDYIGAGAFPRHEDPNAASSRLPCFIDSVGTPCAVAHLMITSGEEGSMLAHEIASSHLKHASVGDIVKDEKLGPRVEAWANDNGFAPHELGLIQPTYVHEGSKKRYDIIIAKINKSVAKAKDLTEKEFKDLQRDAEALEKEMGSCSCMTAFMLYPEEVAKLAQLETKVESLKLPKLSVALSNLLNEKLHLKPGELQQKEREQQGLKRSAGYGKKQPTYPPFSKEEYQWFVELDSSQGLDVAKASVFEWYKKQGVADPEARCKSFTILEGLLLMPGANDDLLLASLQAHPHVKSVKRDGPINPDY